jgi:hypothetical protein
VFIDDALELLSTQNPCLNLPAGTLRVTSLFHLSSKQQCVLVAIEVLEAFMNAMLPITFEDDH